MGVVLAQTEATDPAPDVVMGTRADRMVWTPPLSFSHTTVFGQEPDPQPTSNNRYTDELIHKQEPRVQCTQEELLNTSLLRTHLTLVGLVPSRC